jgi:hypothetical protein
VVESERDANHLVTVRSDGWIRIYVSIDTELA